MATPLSAAQAAEVKRKASQGIPLTDQSNAAAMSLYNASKPMSATQATGATTQAKPATTSAVTPMSATQAIPTTPILNAATNTTGVAPATGYGGATYGTSGAVNAGISANAARLASDPTFKQSEIDRTKSVIAALQAEGKDTSAQTKYLYQNLGYTDPQVQTPSVGQTDNGGYYPSMTPQQIQTEAQYQTDKQRADLLNSVTTQLNALKNNAAYSKQLTNDSRVLEDQQLNRTLNPFSGKTSYDKALVGRQRSIDDATMQANLNNQLDAVQQDLYNFDKLAPEKQQATINELTRIERQYGLDVGALTGSFGGQRTLAGQQFDWGKTVDEANLTGNFKGQQTLAAQNQKFNQDLATKNYDLNNTQVMAALTGRLPDGTKTTAQQQQDLANLWTVAEQTGTIPETLATMYGIPKGTQTQAAKQFAINASMNQQQMNNQNSQFWANYNQNDSQFQQSLANKNQPEIPTAESTSKYTDSMVQRDPDTGAITNVDALRAVINNYGLDDYNKYLLYQRYGMWPKDVAPPVKPSGN